MRAIVGSGSRRMQRHRLVAGGAAERLDLLADRGREAGHAEAAAGAERARWAWSWRGGGSRSRRAGSRASGGRSRRPGARPPCPASGSRRMLEKKPEAALLGSAGADADRGQADADAVEEAAARVVVEQELAHRLLGAVAGQRRGEEFVADRLGEGGAEDGDRGGEDHARAVVGLGADRLEEVAGAVEVDARSPSRSWPRPRPRRWRRGGRSPRAARRSGGDGVRRR